MLLGEERAGTRRREGNETLAEGIIALTMLGKVGTSVSYFDELYKCNAPTRARLVIAEQMRTPVLLSTTKGAEGSIASNANRSRSTRAISQIGGDKGLDCCLSLSRTDWQIHTFGHILLPKKTCGRRPACHMLFWVASLTWESLPT